MTSGPSLSALLVEATGNADYVTAAAQSLTFIRNHLIGDSSKTGTVTKNIIGDSIIVTNCGVSSVGIYPYKTGNYIEGVAVILDRLYPYDVDGSRTGGLS